MIKLSVLLGTLLCVTTLDAQAQGNDPQYIFPSVMEPGRRFPGLDKMSDETLVLSFGEASHGSSYLMKACVSRDAGKTWSNPLEYATVHSATLGLQRRPRLLIDKDGVMHAVFEDHRNGLMARAYHCFSTDNGTNWSDPTLVVQNVSSSLQDFVAAAIDSSNNLIVTYLSSGFDATDFLKHVYLIKSSNKGATWTKPVRVDQFTAGGSCECCQQSIDVGPLGEIAVGLRSNISNRRDIHVALSTNGGTSFEPPILIQDEPWNIDGCPSQGPTVKFDGRGNIHIAWVDARDSRQQPIAYYARLDRGKTATPTNVDMSSQLSNMATYPSVAASVEGNNVVVSWESSMGIYTAQSSNGGLSFEPQLLDGLTMNSGNVSTVWKNDGGSQTVWQANRDGLFDIRTFSFSTTSVGFPPSTSTRIKLSADGYVHISADIDILAVTVFDILGREITSIDVGHTSTLFKTPVDGVFLVSVRTSKELTSHLMFW